LIRGKPATLKEILRGLKMRVYTERDFRDAVEQVRGRVERLAEDETLWTFAEHYYDKLAWLCPNSAVAVMGYNPAFGGKSILTMPEIAEHVRNRDDVGRFHFERFKRLLKFTLDQLREFYG
jgi:hypothetical protein